mgnify:FL=1
MDPTKTYPALMEGKKIMYVHGFGSSGQSGTVTLLRTLMPAATVIAPDLPLHPAEALALLRQTCDAEKPDLIIGTSMGGMYAEMLRGTDRILINPAFEMGDTMVKHNMVGKQTFQSPRTDGIQDFIVTKALVNEYKEITTLLFDGIDEAEQQRVIGLFGDEDTSVDTFDLFAQHYPTAIHFHGGHRLTDKVAMHYLMPLIRQIDDKQTGRQRPIVFIHANTLADSYQKPMPSMHKAYEMLIENYDVYILAPSPTNAPEQITAQLAWVEQYLNAPAFNRVVFSNNANLLYGDYLISRHEHPNFLGSSILFGGNDLKTWDDVIVFFDRLGGQ